MIGSIEEAEEKSESSVVKYSMHLDIVSAEKFFSGNVKNVIAAAMMGDRHLSKTYSNDHTT